MTTLDQNRMRHLMNRIENEFPNFPNFDEEKLHPPDLEILE